MTIQETIKECDLLYENTVKQEQKVKWCDELGALLKNEYAKTYQTCELGRDENGFRIPAAAYLKRAAAWYADGRETTKRELLRDGWLLIPDGEVVRIVPGDAARPIASMAVTYLEDYIPITDIFQDETVCGAPYDRMYIDYLIAKCNYYNRDFSGYNQHMNYFNAILTGFAEDFIRKNEPIRKKLTGWW